MIDHLRVAKTAHFYKSRTALTKKAIIDLFKDVHKRQEASSRVLFRHIRDVRAGVIWSAICFLYDRKPSFLDSSTSVRERVCGFLLIAECSGYVSVFKARLELPTRFASAYLERIGPESVDAAIATNTSVFERIRLRNMSVSKFAMRSKTLEAFDLDRVIGAAGSSRYAPQGYTVQTGSDHFSATPSTGRIAQRSDRIGHELLLDYARDVIGALNRPPAPSSAFINRFAKALDLGSLGAATRPITFAVDVAQLVEWLFDASPHLRFTRKVGATYSELTKSEAEDVLRELDQAFRIEGAGTALDLVAAAGGGRVGAVALNKTRIALRSLSLPLSSGIEVERATIPLGQDEDRLPLAEFLDAKNAFIVLFDQPSLAYIDGTLFRDEAFTNGGTTLLSHLKTEPLLARVSDEKKPIDPPRIAFDAISTFGVVVNAVAVNDDFLVCDDLGDEWADFIGLSTGSTPPCISFYHAKHGALSLSASAFHDSVSQAIKNLGRMSLPVEAMPGKFASWRTTYNNFGIQSGISRVARGAPGSLEIAFENARKAPDAIRRVFIVTSSLSKNAVGLALADIQSGGRPEPHFVQLYWLLMSFFSACTEAGAYGYVVCRP